MTDFDFEILDVINSYGENGVTIDDLHQKHFPDYQLTYNLMILSEAKEENINGIRVAFENANVLKVKYEIWSGNSGLSTPRYFITERGKTLLMNWKRQKSKARCTHRIESIGWALLGATFGTIFGQIATRLLSCP